MISLNLFARLVNDLGEEYLPFYLRIERQLAAMDAKNDALSR
ncbi:hypothetical protein [Polycladidibacter stylochi]|nr:hypothetical protein [Pseudovibrio stylochi]